MAARSSVLLVACAALWGVGCTGHDGSGSASGSGSGGSSSGSASTTSSNPGSTTGSDVTDAGSKDAGCSHPGHVAELGACVISADCACPLSCLPDPQGNRLCLSGCSDSAECVSGEFCDAGRCVVALACDPLAGGVEFDGCKTVTDCQCPLDCFGDGTLGKACERPCLSNLDCLDAGIFCETDAGSCQRAVGCDPGAIAVGEFGKCIAESDCQCPFRCVDDYYRGYACERACSSDADCGDGGETCVGGDAGSCELACTPGLSTAYAACTQTLQCPCPMDCERYPNSYAQLCLACDGGSCAPPSDACTDAGPQAAASQSLLPPVLGTGAVVACSSNADCFCPNVCLPFQFFGQVQFICQAAGAPCTSYEDCPDPTQACLFGMCRENDCGDFAEFGSPCDPSHGENPALVGTGVCLSSLHAVDPVCTEGGDAPGDGGGCSLTPDRRQPQSLCPAGQLCLAGDAGNFCASACDGSPFACDAGNCERLQPAPVPGCPECYGALACLPGPATCSESLPTYLAADGPFDEASVGVEYAPCDLVADCACPLACVFDVDFGVYDCERSCQSAADCPLPQASCLGGFCALSASGCAFDGGLALGASCDAGDSAGTCVDFAPFGLQRYRGTVDPVAVCRANGSAQAQCDPNASRGSEQLCGAGTDCLPLGDGGFGCRPLCDPRASGACPSGQGCFPLTSNSGAIDEGTCVPLGDGGCSLGLPSNDQAPCLVPSDCACGLACVATSPFQSTCLRPCTKVTDCAEDEVCFGEAGQRLCQLNTCDAGSTICTADVGADGTCVVVNSLEQPDALPHAAPEAQPLIASCEQAGTAIANCDPAADRTDLSLRCIPGAVCDTSGTTPTCTALCLSLPDGGHGGALACAAGQYCVPLPVYFDTFLTSGAAVEGACLPARGVH